MDLTAFWNWITHGFQDPTAQNDPGLAAQQAAQTQTQAAQQGSQTLAETTQQGIQGNQAALDQITQLLQPYLQSGANATAAQDDLAGLNGPDAQAKAIAAIQGGPEYNALLGSGSDAILRNAAATGGLRDGNTQAALAQFGPQVLSQLINQQYSRYAGMSGQGLQGALGQGQFGTNIAGQNAGLISALGQGQSGLLQQQGAAQAGADIATANSNQANNPFNVVLGLLSSYLGSGKGANPFAPSTPGAGS